MELKDRQAKYPGRIILKDVQTNAERTYDVILADEATEQGTPINAQTLKTFKQDILNETEDILNEAVAKIKPVVNQTTVIVNSDTIKNDIY